MAVSGPRCLIEQLLERVAEPAQRFIAEIICHLGKAVSETESSEGFAKAQQALVPLERYSMMSLEPSPYPRGVETPDAQVRVLHTCAWLALHFVK
jgi:hypothetical protein